MTSNISDKAEFPSGRQSCEQRIDLNLKERLEQLLPSVDEWGAKKCSRYLVSNGRTASTTDLNELRSEVLDLMYQEAADSLLSVEIIQTFRLCLSYGGPADYFELDYSETNEAWIGGRYLFQDWFDGARREISAVQADQLSQVFGIYPCER